jgi:hypothetical protein
MMLVIADKMANTINTYLFVANTDLSNSEQIIAVAAASINPVDRAMRNKALPLILLTNFTRSVIQKIKNPGAEKSKEIKKLSSVSAGNSPW